MREFQQMTQFPNGCKIDHLADRSITVLKHPKADGVIIEMRRGDVEAKFSGMEAYRLYDEQNSKKLAI